MADTTPKLNSATDASEVRYAPLSWAAVAAAAVGVAFVFTILFLGWTAVSQGKSQYIPVLLAVPVIGVLLAFAARRLIRNSEGARTGIEYANFGWWACVVSGLCYGAYLLAVDFSVRSDATRQMTQWAGKLTQANPANPDDPVVREAFIKTIDIANQTGSQVKDPKVFQATFGIPFGLFRQTNLMLISARNKDTAKVTAEGLLGWEQKEEELTCEVRGDLTCAEGKFPLLVKMKSVVADKTRQWQIMGIDKFILEDQYHRPLGLRTRYGWVVHRAIGQAEGLAINFAYTVGNQQLRQKPLGPNSPFMPPVALGQSLAIDAFVRRRIEPAVAEKVLLSSLDRAMLLGGAGGFWAGDTDLPDEFFAREDGKPLSADDRLALKSCWAPKVPAYDRITPPGHKNQMAAQWNPIVEVSDTQVMVKYPLEMKPEAGEFITNPQMYTTGRLVVVFDDPQLAADLTAARKELAAVGGDPTRAIHPTPPDDIATRDYKYRAVRIESNLPKLVPPSPKGAGGP
jgi:hypothetical protein